MNAETELQLRQAKADRGRLVAALTDAGAVVNGDKVNCPFHGDAHASGGVHEREGLWFYTCQTCEWAADGKHTGDVVNVLRRARGVDFSGALGALGISNGNGQSKATKKRIVATYDYHDKTGVLLFQTVRFEPKDFSQRRPDGSGGWVWNLKDVPRVLYRLPALASAPTHTRVLVVEGEKDVDALVKIGLTATTNPQGAGKWKRLADDSILNGRPLAIIADADEAGRKHAADVGRRLCGRAADVRVLELPGAKDAAEFIEQRDSRTADEIKREIETLIAAAPEVKPEPARTSAPTADYRWSDLTNAEALGTKHGSRLRWCAGLGWLDSSEGSHWRIDVTGNVERLAADTIRGLYGHAQKLGDEARKALVAHALRSENAARIRAMIDLARHLADIAVRDDAFDRDPWAFNTPSGTIEIDPASGEYVCREHRREDLITKLAPVSY